MAQVKCPKCGAEFEPVEQQRSEPAEQPEATVPATSSAAPTQ